MTERVRQDRGSPTVVVAPLGNGAFACGRCRKTLWTPGRQGRAILVILRHARRCTAGAPSPTGAKPDPIPGTIADDHPVAATYKRKKR
jgi:hypothetical protein